MSNLKSLQEYLKTEFQAYPRLFRDVASFMAREDLYHRVMEPVLVDACPECESPNLTVEQIQSKGGVRYQVTCQCSKKGPLAISRATAVWQWYSLKGMPSHLFENPLVHTEHYHNVKNSWYRGDAKFNIAMWVAALNVQKKVWQAHRETSDYHTLSAVDKEFIDLLGVLNGLLRKDAVALLAAIGVSLAESSAQEVIECCEKRVCEERKKMYPRFREHLPPGFHGKVRELFAV